MRVVIAPDSFGGTLSPVEAAQAIAEGWRRVRPDDDLVLRPMSDGGEGLLDAVRVGLTAVGADVEVRTTEVVGPRGLPVDARWLMLDGGAVAVVESAEACGLHLLDLDRRDPRMTTTWGVGQLIEAAAVAGARRVLVGLGGSATVDGGAGALSGLGWRVTVADGSGLKIGGEDLPRIAGIAPGWVDPAVDGVAIEVLVDVTTELLDAARVFGPQKGADEAAVAHLEAGLLAAADVLEAAFDRPGLREVAGTGAAGGLGFALAAAHGAQLRSGAAAVADLVGLAEAVEGADVIVTGEGRLDPTSMVGKVVGEVAELGAGAGARVAVACGQAEPGATPPGWTVVEASPAGPDGFEVEHLRAAGADLAARIAGPA